MGRALCGGETGAAAEEDIGQDGGRRGGSGRVYVGVCVDAACSLGVCAERNAIFNMITCGESVLRRVVAVDWDGRALPPCGACRELMAELMPETYKSVEIMLDYEAARVVTLGDLTPEWWF